MYEEVLTMKINLKFNGGKEKSADGSRPASNWNLDLQLEMTPEEFIQSGKQMVETFKLGVENADRIIDHAESAKMRILERDHQLKMMREERRRNRPQSKE